MSTPMIRLADAQAAIRSVIEAYQKDINQMREAAAQRDPEDLLVPDGAQEAEQEAAVLLAAELCKEGAERARHALATCRVFEAVEFQADRFVDKKWIPERMHGIAEEQAVREVLSKTGDTLNRAGMIRVTREEGREPTTTRISIAFAALRPMDARWKPYVPGEEVPFTPGEEVQG